MPHTPAPFTRFFARGLSFSDMFAAVIDRMPKQTDDGRHLQHVAYLSEN